MNKININLHPQKQKSLNLTLEKLIPYTALVKLGVGVILILILFLQILILSKERKYKLYSQDWEKQEEKFNTLKSLKEKITSLEKQAKEFEGLTTPKYKAAFLLEDIFAALPKNIWFAELNFKEDFMNLKGYVVKWKKDYLASLDIFINSLRERDYFSSKFSKINIKESKKEQINNVEVLKFIIECRN